VLRPADLAGETRLTTPRAVNPTVYDRVNELFDDAGYRFERVQDTVGFDPRDFLHAIREGLGIEFAPSWFAEMSDSGDSVITKAIDPPVRMPDTVVAWLAEGPRVVKERVPVVRAVSEALFADDAAA
jgi:DNA-binding transcriptional LysR family regulator